MRPRGRAKKPPKKIWVTLDEDGLPDGVTKLKDEARAWEAQFETTAHAYVLVAPKKRKAR